MEDEMREYLIKRFLYNNHKKYHKYCLGWIENLLPNQLAYFVEEKKRKEKKQPL